MTLMLWIRFIPLLDKATSVSNLEGSKSKAKMSSSLNILGRIVLFALLSYFLWRVVFSGQKLLEDKIGSTKSTQYSKWRLFPSFSICFKMKNMTPESLLRDIDGNLQRGLDNVLVYFDHSNVSESG